MLYIISECRPALRPVQVSKIAESGTDYRKFYINNGQKIMRLRAETKCALAQTDMKTLYSLTAGSAATFFI